MSQENRNKLAAALRSGKYKQGKLTLRNKKDEFCCLGVACDISGLGEWTSQFDCWFYEVSETDKENAILPRAVMKWLGFNYKRGNHRQGSNPTSLVEMNDHGATFDQIAAILEDETVEW